ncbi:MAG: serine acetyltransferase [Bacteroides sp.]|nr:serine acetyltransferase [Bacteroides sp.]
MYFPHLLFIIFGGGKLRHLVFSDLRFLQRHIVLPLRGYLLLLYCLHTNSYYRNVFYSRLGSLRSILVRWYRPGDKHFNVPIGMPIGEHFCFDHPYSTYLNATSIGKNFHCINCTTIGKKNGKLPEIGDNVTLGANVVIIGDVKIGNNVIVGAGSVVVKDVPDNSVVVGNPARIIKKIDINNEFVR